MILDEYIPFFLLQEEQVISSKNLIENVFSPSHLNCQNFICSKSRDNYQVSIIKKQKTFNVSLNSIFIGQK